MFFLRVKYSRVQTKKKKNPTLWKYHSRPIYPYTHSLVRKKEKYEKTTFFFLWKTKKCVSMQHIVHFIIKLCRWPDACDVILNPTTKNFESCIYHPHSNTYTNTQSQYIMIENVYSSVYRIFHVLLLFYTSTIHTNSYIQIQQSLSFFHFLYLLLFLYVKIFVFTRSNNIIFFSKIFIQYIVLYMVYLLTAQRFSLVRILNVKMLSYWVVVVVVNVSLYTNT